MLRVNDFSVLELSKNVIVIVLNNSLRFDNLIQPIHEDLYSKRFRGVVYVDALLSNGLSSRRFFVTQYHGEQLDLATVKKQINIPNEVLTKSNDYFYHHKELLDLGVLTASTKQRFL